jgi:type VI protein secretion system component VasK
MGTLRLLLAATGILLFVACALLLILGFAAQAFALEQLAWIDSRLGGWLFGALLVVLLARWTVIRLERGREGQVRGPEPEMR